MRFLGLAVGAVLCCVATLVQAQAPLPATSVTGALRPLLTSDEAQAWRAVGRLDSDVSFCTGTLIAPDLVLTAAHCAFDPETGERFEASELVFSPGLRNGRADAVRTGQRIFLLPRYRLGAGESLEMIGRDLALVELQHAISVPGITPMTVGYGLGRNDLVTIVSYGQDRETHASIEEGCHVLQHAGSVRALDCFIVAGSSGAPVMQIVDGVPRIMAVVSAVGHGEGEEVALAVTLDEQLTELLAQRVRDGSFGTQTSSTTFLNQMATGRQTIGGARFLRP